MLANGAARILVGDRRLLVLALSVLATPLSAQPAPPAPPTGGIVHGTVYFPVGSARRLQPTGVDPVEHLAPRIPDDAFVVVDGKTDTVGSAHANLALSLRRARSVADELVARGVDPMQITLRACGERDLNRFTPDNTPEPLNRAAFFDWRDTPWPVSLNCQEVRYAPPAD